MADHVNKANKRQASKRAKRSATAVMREENTRVNRIKRWYKHLLKQPWQTHIASKIVAQPKHLLKRAGVNEHDLPTVKRSPAAERKYNKQTLAGIKRKEYGV